MASNWHSWADSYTGWFKSNFGFLAFGTSPISMRVLGLIWIGIGAVVLVVTVMQFAARGRLLAGTCRFIRIERLREWRLRFALCKARPILVGRGFHNANQFSIGGRRFSLPS